MASYNNILDPFNILPATRRPRGACTQEDILVRSRMGMCKDCRNVKSSSGRCMCTGNTPQCDAYREPGTKPCECWYCVDKRGENK